MGKIPKRMGPPHPELNLVSIPIEIEKVVSIPIEIEKVVSIPIEILSLQPIQNLTDDFLCAISNGERERMKLLSKMLNATPI